MPSLKLRQDTVRTLLYVGERAKQQCIYWDEALECFGVRVYPTGRRFYVCSYRFNRRKRLAKLGRVDALTLDEARKKAKRYLAQAANNQDPQEEADRLRTSTMVRELVAAYIEEHAKKKKRTWKEDQSYLKRLLLPAHGARLAVTVESSDIEKIHSGHGAKYPGAANNFLTVARKMFNWARIAGYVPKNHPNPTAGIVRFPERKRKRFVTTVEMPVLLREIEAEENEYARHGLWLLLLTGLRSIELLRSKWESIDWDMRTLFIGLTKNGEPLLAPLSDAAIIRLKMIPRLPDNPYIICGRKRGRPLYGVGTVLRRILKRAG
jgi:integrase